MTKREAIMGRGVSGWKAGTLPFGVDQRGLLFTALSRWPMEIIR